MTDTARGATLVRAPQSTKRKLLRLGIAGILGTGALAVAAVAQAGTTGIQKVTILSTGLAFGGYSFADIGTYTVIKGYALDAVNPTDPKNSLITDINLAPRDANGNVDILLNFYMIIPTNLANGNGKILYEPPNRGSKQFGAMNRSTGGNDPASVTSATALANTFLWPQGYATVFSGWEYEGDPTSAGNLSATMAGTLNGTTPLTSPPVAYGPTGATITGPGYEYIVSPGMTYTLAYPAASATQGAPNAVLTHRVHLDDTPSAGLGNVPTNWSIYGTGDMNGDGIGDILWRDNAGDVAVWFMAGTTVASSVSLGNVPTAWNIVATDRMGDIFWEDSSSNYSIWQVNGSQVTSASLGNVPSNWVLAGVGDFDGNGSTDILWRDNVSNAVAIWYLNGTSIETSAGFGPVPSTTHIVQTGDYNGDGKTDILWLDTSGNLSVWFLDGSSVLSAATIANVGTSWSVQSQNAE